MFTLQDILQGNQDNVHLQRSVASDPEMIFSAAQHDSRMIERGNLFVAIKGVRVDGHQFIPAVARAGAAAVLCTEPSGDVPADFLQIVVPDTIAALHATARVRAARQKNTTFIGITGSNGKTSTKEATAAVLSQQGPTLKTFASYNNEVGYPLTLLRLEPEHRYAVLEMGAQWVGELAWLSTTIARPNWSIITNVGAAHLEYFGSQERVILAKSELVQVLAPEGIAILNYDDPNVRGMAAKTDARVLYYGLSEEAEVRGSDIAGDTLRGQSFTLHYHEQQVRVQLHIPGAHGVIVALAAAAAGCAAEMQLEDIGAALESLTPARGRGEIKAGPNGSILIDDTYNANRQSIVAIVQAIQTAELPPGGKRWAVLGDIFELGRYARAEHRMSGEALAGNVDYLIAVGDMARYYLEGAILSGMPSDHIYYFPADVEDEAELAEAKHAAAEVLRQQVQATDLVLLKGSRGMRMETMMTMFD
ncbi:MAG TPA: UDP-N-acetylmuramoyl-tripeptide--D-alanyl-D-alanine ligase [Ktedonobacteraceae bacterium]|nr:UDP-N-acetylmuramoyl-tripeptide--D-alanyl-D-alanine ligase [Ktedonobacteraceae bacterium]